MKRTEVVVRWVKAHNQWGIYLDGKWVWGWLTRVQAIQDGADVARRHEPSQLVVRNKGNGRISFERTYPRSSDPKRHKG